MSVDQQKHELRKRYQQILQGLDHKEKHSASCAIQKKLFTVPEIISSRVYSVYVGVLDEIETTGIIQGLWEDPAKIVLAPRINGDTLEMFQITSFNDLVGGKFGLREPASYLTSYISNDIDIVIVPGLAFDVRGIRLGRGLGYYDRFLSSIKAKHIALAYDCQITETLPSNAHDIRMDMIITEKRIILVRE